MGAWKLFDKSVDITAGAVVRFLKENLGAFPVMIEYVVFCEVFSRYVPLRLSLLLSAIVLYAMAVIRNFSGLINSRGFDGLPIPDRKFVKIDGSRLRVDDDDATDMTLYLLELEKYFDSVGIYKVDKKIDKKEKKR